MSRIERLINLIAGLLEAPRPLTAEDIRTRIAGYDQDSHEAFRRAFERDKEALRDMGVPLELRATDPLAEQDDGYIIPKERYYLPELDLEPDEIAALRIATETVLGATELGAAAGLRKLSMAEEVPSRPGPRVVAGADVGLADPQLAEVHSAMLERHPIEFAYEDGRGNHSSRRVEPWGLVHRAGHWYLVGLDRRERDQRTFRVGRIVPPVRRLQGTYEVPEGFDAAARVGAEAWEFGPDQGLRVRVRFDASTRWWAEQNLAHLDMDEALEGALDVSMAAANADAVLGWVIGWHGTVTIVEPDSLVDRLVSHLEPWTGPSPP